MSFFDDVTGGRDLLRRSLLRLRRLFLPSTGGLHIGDNMLDAEADSGGNIDPFWKRADATSANLSDPVSLGAAPNSVDYLVGQASGDLSAEIVVGTTPGGELGNTWPSPTVDSTHSGSAHHNASHTVASHSDTTGTGAELNTLTDGSNADSLHAHKFVEILDRDLATVEVVNDTDETTIYSHSIPGNTLGSTGGIRVLVSGDYENSTGGDRTLIIKVKLGSTTLLTTSAFKSTTNAQRRKWFLTIWLMNTATDAQRCSAHLIWSRASADTFPMLDVDASTGTANGAGYGTAAEDTTGALTFAVTSDHNAAGTNLSIRKQMAMMELFPAT